MLFDLFDEFSIESFIRKKRNEKLLVSFCIENDNCTPNDLIFCMGKENLLLEINIVFISESICSNNNVDRFMDNL